MYKFKLSGHNPPSISFLVIVIIPKNFDTHFATSEVGGQRMKHSLCASDSDRKFALSAASLPKKTLSLYLKGITT